jgi:deoxyribose-phosphate aldolase
MTPNLEDPSSVAALIDHTLLKADASIKEVNRACREARELGFASVCINPYWASYAAEALAGARSRVCTVIGFPLGANTTSVKIAEAEEALSAGALELDMVQNVGALRSGRSDVVASEIRRLAELAHSRKAILKVIIETCLLTDEEKIASCTLAAEAGADFVKTSTGFSTGGADTADVELMRRIVGPGMGVKASGGVRTLDAVRHMVAAGATRIGTSSGVQILAEFQRIHLASSTTPAATSGETGY